MKVMNPHPAKSMISKVEITRVTYPDRKTLGPKPYYPREHSHGKMQRDRYNRNAEGYAQNTNAAKRKEKEAGRNPGQHQEMHRLQIKERIDDGPEKIRS